MRARYYDPTIGRFLSEDTYTGQATDPLSLNLYTYCKNNPILYMDPTGNYADPKYQTENPIVYNALTDLTDSWNNLDALEKTASNYLESMAYESMKKEISSLANKVREIGDTQIVKLVDIPKYSMNSVEQVLYNWDSTKGLAMLVAGGFARYDTQEVFGDGYPTDNDADAFRHTFWNYIGTRSAGAEYCGFWTNAHEFGYPSNVDSYLHCLETRMDIYNNNVGRSAQAIKGQSSIEVILNIVKNGGCLKIVDGKLARSDGSGADY